MCRLLVAVTCLLVVLSLTAPAYAARRQRVHVDASSMEGVRVQCRNNSLHTVRRGHTAACRVINLRAYCGTDRYTWITGAGPWHTLDCGWHRVGRRQRIVVGVANT